MRQSVTAGMGLRLSYARRGLRGRSRLVGGQNAEKLYDSIKFGDQTESTKCPDQRRQNIPGGFAHSDARDAAELKDQLDHKGNNRNQRFLSGQGLAAEHLVDGRQDWRWRGRRGRWPRGRRP